MNWAEKLLKYGLHKKGYSEVTAEELMIAEKIRSSPKPLKEALDDLERIIREVGLEELL
ncbi:hypothetical protein [Thermococcus barophilus]|uniref:Uncharacterized protein n=1 Tax=Thermococcus barophilus TaxID=55802 RepID=A0A0S1XCE9_THEBA|nr:hypothetical protein [Thermococcus barophilus]ALM75457.1 hypothetical protein TBCH5v1_1543 [Thermococcus barophilus]